MKLFLYRHARRFGQVYAISSKVFAELVNYREQFKPWIAAAMVELDSLFERELHEPQDWNAAFQMAKKKQEDLGSFSR